MVRAGIEERGREARKQGAGRGGERGSEAVR